MNNIVYAICDEPFCLWESDIKDAAKSFLKSIDHDYFRYIAQRAVLDLESPENGLRAATSMRLALFQGGETLFLLIGALLQAPKCPHAWVGQCSTSELRTVIERIKAGEPFLMQNSRVSEISWQAISREVLSHCRPDTPMLKASIESFARFWEQLALNHTDQFYVDEYNGLKHGFRISSGGFEVKFGTHTREGTPPPAEDMKSLGSSRWGATFRVIRKFDRDVKGSRSRQSILTAVNWDATAVASSLILVADSISNITTYLGRFCGLKELRTRLPDAEVFEVASRRVGLQTMSMPMVGGDAYSTTREQLMTAIKLTALRQLVNGLNKLAKARANMI